MIGLVVVSHSRLLADGVAELAGQMAPDVTIAPSGGDGAGGLGTDFDAVTEAVSRADSGTGVVVLFDLGSARMVAEMAAEASAGDVRVVDAPLVEGAVAAAVAAQRGSDLDEVAAAATGDRAAPAGARGEASGGGSAGVLGDGSAGGSEDGSVGVPGGGPAGVSGGGSAETPGDRAAGIPGGGSAELSGGGSAELSGGGSPGAPAEHAVREEVELTNEVGLHARPAALVARSLTGLDARVRVRFGPGEADATSVLALMGLGAPGGARVEVVATGPDAAEAVRRLRDLAARDFDE
ncbi:PTS hybrid protein [Saccharothrix australiensis]|uniref:Phosphocarrier protein HPr n=1 Tax=Saccharothrix australiensis TaxID=2072 RepID=A0A495W7K1_9PSEU|nr:PTS hybrid protein [Saccharothrix australiensis]